MPLIIAREQRDAIYELVMDHLTGIGDVWTCVERREYATARRLGREFYEDLRLLEVKGANSRVAVRRRFGSTRG